MTPFPRGPFGRQVFDTSSGWGWRWGGFTNPAMRIASPCIAQYSGGHRTGQETVEGPPSPCGSHPSTPTWAATRVRSLDRPAAQPAHGGAHLTETSRHNDQIPTDPRTVILTALFCLTTAVTLPPDQLHSLTDLLNLAVTVFGRR